MIRDSTPRGMKIPTPDELAAEFEQPIAVVQEVPAGWRCSFGQQRLDGFLCHVDANYWLDRQLVAVIQSSRPVPDSFRVKSEATLGGQLNTFLANSGRSEQVTAPSSTSEPEWIAVSLDGDARDAERLSFGECTSARITTDTTSIIVTAPDEVWQTASDLAYFRPGQNWPPTHWLRPH